MGMCPYKAIAETHSCPVHKGRQTNVLLFCPTGALAQSAVGGEKEIERGERGPNTFSHNRGHHASVIA